jgi:hypothetical protein
MALKKCGICKQELPDEKFKKGGSGLLRSNCDKCNQERYRVQVKLTVFAHFGFKCNCCGETQIMFLSLDHISGIDKSGKSRNKEQIYQECIRDKFDSTKYQLLCMNCNFAKGHWGECPHKLGISSEKAIAGLLIKSGLSVQELNIYAESST